MSARERIMVLLREGARQGVMSETQVTLLDRALAMRETLVSDQMTPWGKVLKIDESMGRRRVLELVLNSPYSRFPVVTGRGGVLGVVETLDLALSPEASIRELLKPLARLPENLSVREGLQKLADDGAAMALVTAVGREVPLGIVTAKDLVEPLTGEMRVF
jgi:putative hemolysin